MVNQDIKRRDWRNSTVVLRVLGSKGMIMDTKISMRYGAGSYVLWQNRLYRVLYTISPEGNSPLLALRYADTQPLGCGDEDEYEVTVSARQVKRSPWH
jgi:hypothetical protein